jgi:hypothetical protein
MRGDDEHQTAHTPIALMLCSKLENLATMPRRAQAQHKCEDNIILCYVGPNIIRTTSSFGTETPVCCARAWKPFNKPLA